MSHTEPASPDRQPTPPDDPYVTVMQKAEQRRKFFLMTVGLSVLGVLVGGIVATMQTVARMNHDIPGVFAGTQELAAKAPLKLVLPPKPPSPSEFRAQELEYPTPQVSAEEADIAVEVPTPIMEP